MGKTKHLNINCCTRAEEICAAPCSEQLCSARCRVRCGWGGVFCDPVTCSAANQAQCSQASQVCEAGYTALGKKCLKMMDKPANYLAALTTCISMGSSLASIESMAEQEIVYSMAGSTGAWLGLTDFLDEGVFSWVDGTAVGFTNWRGGQPNNINNNQHCVWMTGSGVWDDIACKESRYFICQRESKLKIPRVRQ